MNLAGFSVVIGGLLSFLYEQFSFKWHGKDLKKWIFSIGSVIIGSTVAVLSKEVVLPSLSWNTAPEIVSSVMSIAQYGLGVLLAGAVWFSTKITKKTE
jgi:hypothetical protein